MLKKYKRRKVSIIVSLIVLILLNLIMSQTYAREKIRINGNTITSEGNRELLDLINKYEQGLILKDLADGQSHGTSIEEVENELLNQKEFERINYSDDKFQALLVPNQETQVLSELYLLFYQSELIYANLFDYDIQIALENPDTNILQGMGIVNFHGIHRLDKYLVGDSIANLGLESYLDNQLISQKLLTQSIYDYQLRDLNNIIDSLDIEDKLIDKLINDNLINIDSKELDDQTDLETDNLYLNMKQLFKAFENKLVDYDDFKLVFQTFTSSLEPEKPVTSAEVLSLLGKESYQIIKGHNQLIAYMSNDRGYQTYEFIFNHDKLVYYTETYIDEETFQDFPSKALEELFLLKESGNFNDVDIYTLLGKPSHRVSYVGIPLQLVQWQKINAQSVSSIIMKNSNGRISLEIIER